MLTRIRRPPSPALVISTIALVVAVGGGSFALATAGRKDKKIVKRVANQQITRRAPALSVKHARTADNAGHASTADNAVHAVNADNANDAGHASTADNAMHASTADNADQAMTANTAKSADHANSADTATNAQNATNADSANNANDLDGLDSSAFLRSDSRGVAEAGARVTDNGTVEGLFNRNGGPPTVTHTANSGVYTISFPNTSVNVNFDIIEASLTGAPGEVAVNSVNGNPIVQTFNSAGAAADKGFTMVVFPASFSG
jgi:hypothetical protein